MPAKLGKIAAFCLVLAIMAIVNSSTPVRADGGLIVPYDLWANLKEGQQIAVVTLQNRNTAKVDLFISILDKTNESHEVVFFLPLGADATNFYAVEQNLGKFDRETTAGLDSILRDSADKKHQALQGLFSGALLNNGVLLVPLWAPMLLSGCGPAAEQTPEATFQTESSEISIYGIDENTDLEALINTTGLHSSVQQTLSRLRGQRIAVVKLQTRPQGSGTATVLRDGEPGLHLSWYTSFVSAESGATYSYPLGTGASWSKPIELTRVYIVAPTGIDFDVSYPAIGSKQSGYDYIKGARIADYYQVPAYAVDEARGSFGRVWRAIYTQSNPMEDIVIVAKPQTALGRFGATIEESALALAFAFALIVGLALWILGWHFLMPRFLGRGPGQPARLQWYYSLIYPGINAVLILFPGTLLYVVFLLGGTIPSLAILFFILGGVSIGVFEAIHGGHLGVSRGRALRAFILVSLASSGAYLLLAVAFAKFIRII